MSKIQQRHLSRAAYVYVRQSIQQQVQNNTESRRRQYALVGKAKELGWKDVEVVDEDMGCSGSGTVDRRGFERLVSSVGMGQVGSVFSLEASRLARNNKDWYQLIDLCGMVGTLIVDYDGIYDPAILNDRLLLGLKGTMNEFELNLIRQRTEQGLKEKAKRGELYTMVPVGYLRTRDNRCEKDPDRRIQSSVQLLFHKFAELGSARQVIRWFRREKIELPTVQYDTGERRIEWRPPFYNTVIRFIQNPIYAGAYAFGRTTTTKRYQDGRIRKRSGVRVSTDNWLVLLKGHHEPYISWEEYEHNTRRLIENATGRGLMRTPGAPRSGKSLLAGLLRCRRCGRKMHVAYTGSTNRVARYFCRGANINHGVSRCINFGGLHVDAAVERQLLEVVQPAAVEAATKASADIRTMWEQKNRALELSLQQARYESERAFRQYNATDPENRLVAAELEKRWNGLLEKVHGLEGLLSQANEEKVEMSESDTAALLNLAADLPAVWRDERCDMRIKKMITRQLIKEIVADVDTEPGIILLTVHWKGGLHSALKVKKNRPGINRYTTDDTTLALIGELAMVMPDNAIAVTLNRLGRKSGMGKTWNKATVRSARSRRGIQAYDPGKQKEQKVVTMDQAATRLKISPMSVQRLIKRGIIHSRQVSPYAPQLISAAQLQTPLVLQAAEAVRNRKTVPLPNDPNQISLDFQSIRR